MVVSCSTLSCDTYSMTSLYLSMMLLSHLPTSACGLLTPYCSYHELCWFKVPLPSISAKAQLLVTLNFFLHACESRRALKIHCCLLQHKLVYHTPQVAPQLCSHLISEPLLLQEVLGCAHETICRVEGDDKHDTAVQDVCIKCSQSLRIENLNKYCTFQSTNSICI
jgi:hypothetical protein